MLLWIRRVQAHPDIPYPGLNKQPCNLWRDESSIGGDDCPQPNLASMKCQRIEVAAEKWLATCEYEDWNLEPCQLVHQAQALFK